MGEVEGTSWTEALAELDVVSGWYCRVGGGELECCACFSSGGV